jgi:hypothetical protein
MNTPNFRFAQRPSTQQAADMNIDDDSLRFVRGLAYGLACVVPFWCAVIASVWLAL